MKHTKQSKSEVGQLGEDIAADFLMRKRYKLIERNYSKPWGEIDIIAQAPQKTIVFTEVKTMRSSYSKEIKSDRSSKELKPEDQITPKKLRNMTKSAVAFANTQPDLIGPEGWRIDLIAITLHGGEEPQIAHYQNIS